MIERIKSESLRTLFHIRLEEKQEVAQLNREPDMVLSHGDGPSQPATAVREGRKVGRNEPCPCGSGKKYKKCCGRAA